MQIMNTPADIAGGGKLIEMGVVPVLIHVMSEIDGVSWEEILKTHALSEPEA